MTTPNVSKVKRGIAVLWDTLQCPICLDLLTMPVSTKCDHQFCKFCMTKLLSSDKQNRANCPVCKAKITKRSLHESPGFQRLVAGLQDMIQAYEHDTGTNYFTGMTNQRGDSRDADAVVSTQADETADPDTMQHADEDLPRSLSSTVAAQNAFERLMGFDNTSPLLTDNEGLDSGLGGVLKQANSPEKLVEPAETKQTEEIPEQSEGKRRRRSSRRNSQEEPGVTQQKQKQRQSLEKVAEWLMKVPAGDSLELPAEEKCDSDDSDGGSSTSTLDVQLYNRDVNPKREDHAKALEDQVFGAVYKRERRARRPTSLPAFVKPATPPTSVESERRSEEKTDKEDEEAEADHTGVCVSDVGGSEKEGGDDGSRLVPEAEACPPKRSATRSMHGSVQQVDSDLQAQAASVRKKPDRRRGKGVRAPGPLVLVGIHNEETCVETGRQREEVQVHIENYPSSEDQTPPSVRSSRRSRRLQPRTQTAGRSTRGNPPGDESGDAKQPGEDVDVGASPERGRVAAVNGCIYDHDIGGIEHVGSGEGAARAAEPAPPVEKSAAGSSVKEEAAGPEGPEDEDDSEMDTEQLLRSFKGTKRKSFHLGPPNWNRSCGSHEGNVHGSSEGSGGVRGKRQATQETNGGDHFSCSDLIPPTNSPAQTGERSRIDPEQVGRPLPPAGDGLVRSSSSCGALSPNKVSTLHVESPHLSVVPHVVDSGIRFLPKEVGEGVGESRSEPMSRNSQRQTSSEEHLLHSDSLTPDGLGMRAELRGEETSVHSSINLRKRRKVQRLRSSSESDEALPTLTQIFRTSEPHSGADVGGDQSAPCGDGAAAQLSRPPACPSPDCVHSSQASVDLFGTPEECNVPMNGMSVSMEASQFSSEVLVTQQKIEMQKELVRLEKLMALVTEVLQEKEDDDPAGEVPSETPEGSKKTRPDRCEPDAEQGPDRRAAADRGREGADGPGASNHRCAAGTGESVKGSKAKTPKNSSSPSEDKENNTRQRDGSKEKMVLVSSGLGPSEQIMVKRFARQVGARVVSQVTPEVTHVIMYTDDLLVCERTLKYFLGIAGRKWVVSFQWISECFKQKKLLDESAFEVRGDVVNGPNHLGPMRARTTADNELLMNGHSICFQGTFTDMTTDEMERMVELCGAAVVKDPLLLDGKQTCHQLVIVQPGSASGSTNSRLSRHATVVTRGWLLDTVATYTLQSYSSYVT